MFIHIGNNNTVLAKDIITILDRDTVEDSETTKSFIEKFINEHLVLNSNTKDVKSYVIVETNDKNKKYGLYTSNISSQALYNRMNK